MVKNYHYMLFNIPEEHKSHTARNLKLYNEIIHKISVKYVPKNKIGCIYI